MFLNFFTGWKILKKKAKKRKEKNNEKKTKKKKNKIEGKRKKKSLKVTPIAFRNKASSVRRLVRL